jgi:hypothetical protein
VKLSNGISADQVPAVDRTALEGWDNNTLQPETEQNSTLVAYCEVPFA